jgi:hypothetical protein
VKHMEHKISERDIDRFIEKEQNNTAYFWTIISNIWDELSDSKKEYLREKWIQTDKAPFEKLTKNSKTERKILGETHTRLTYILQEIDKKLLR